MILIHPTRLLVSGVSIAMVPRELESLEHETECLQVGCQESESDVPSRFRADQFVCWKWCILRFFGNLLETFTNIFQTIIHNFFNFRGNSQDTYHGAVQESNLFLCGSEWWFLLRGLSEDEAGHSPLWPSKH